MQNIREKLLKVTSSSSTNNSTNLLSTSQPSSSFTSSSSNNHHHHHQRHQSSSPVNNVAPTTSIATSILSSNNLLNLNQFFTSSNSSSSNIENICLSSQHLNHPITNSSSTLINTESDNTNQYLADIGFYSDIEQTRSTKNQTKTSNKQNQNLNVLEKHNHHHNHRQNKSFNNSYINNEEDDDDVPMLNPNYNPSEDQTNEFNLNKSDLQKSHNAISVQSDHCHVPKEDKDLDKKRNAIVWRKLITVLILCVLFMIGEIVGGIIAQSISIQTDAAHMAADIAGFFFSIVAIYVSDKEPTRRMSFGFYRSEVLGALFSTLVIWILTGILVYLAVLRVINRDFEIEPVAMVATASCGVVFNIIMYFVLHTNKCFKGVELKHHGHSHSGDGHGHGHSHGHGHRHGHEHEHSQENNHGHSHSNNDHGHSHNHSHNHDHNHSHSTPKKSSNSISIPINDNYMSNNSINCSDQVAIITETDDSIQTEQHNDSSNINLRAAAIHVIGDFIQSVGVLIAAVLILINPEYKLADPICTFIFSILVFATTAPIIKDIYFVLMEAIPVNLNYDLVVQDLCSIRNVKKAHNLHIWCLTMDKFALSVHLAIEKDADTQAVLKEANYILRSKYKIERTTIQVEYFMESMENCDQCKLPK